MITAALIRRWILLSMNIVLVSSCFHEGKIIETFPLPVQSVTNVSLIILDSNTGDIRIRATGLVGSEGWSKPVLVPEIYTTPPEDGIYEFHFKAVPPEEAAAAVITSIEVEHDVTDIPDGMLGAKISSETDSITALLADAVLNVAFFEFRSVDPVQRFIIKLTENSKIEHARGLLDGSITSLVSVMGTIIKTQADYNPDWSYHLDPESILFFEAAVEVCDANMQYIEENLVNVGGAFLPNNVWCPWGSYLTREITKN